MITMPKRLLSFLDIERKDPMISRTAIARLEDEAHNSARRSAHQRELEALRRQRRQHLRRVFALPALIGAAVCIHQITLDTLTGPDQVILFLAALCIVPFLATFDVL